MPSSFSTSRTMRLVDLDKLTFVNPWVGSGCPTGKSLILVTRNADVEGNGNRVLRASVVIENGAFTKLNGGFRPHWRPVRGRRARSFRHGNVKLDSLRDQQPATRRHAQGRRQQLRGVRPQLIHHEPDALDLSPVGPGHRQIRRDRSTECDVPKDEPERLYRPDELPRSASGHVPQWVLDETRGHAPEQAVPQRHSTRHPIRATLGVALMLVLGVGAWASMTGRLPVSLGDAAAGEGLREFPTPGFEAAERPIGVPPRRPRRYALISSWRCRTTAARPSRTTPAARSTT